MRTLIKKDCFILFTFFSLHLLLASFILRFLYPIKYASLNLFFSELLSKPFNVPLLLIFLSESGIYLLLILISKRIFPGKRYLLVIFIYSISPWSLYLTVAQSFYIFLLFFLLLFFYSMFLLKEDNKFPGTLLFVLSIIIICYSSFLFVIILPLLIVTILITGLVSFRLIKKGLIISCIILIPLIILMVGNQAGLKNISKNEVKIFDNPGIINSVNVFLGESRSSGYGDFAKLAENKYIYFSKYFLLKFIKNIIPTTFFTPQEKLLNFSFTAPIYSGFIPPFLYGLYLVFKSLKLRKFLPLFFILTLPSFLSEPVVDLNRLSIIEPAIIFLISYGVINLKINKRDLLSKTVLIFIILSVLIQHLVTFSDIIFREYNRYQQIYYLNMEIGKQ